MKTRWLDRYGAIRLPHMALCLSRAELVHAVKSIKSEFPSDGDWCEHGGARVHLYPNGDSLNQAAFVCIDATADTTGPEIAGMLVHEAVHIVQAFMKAIGEKRPSDEFQAYCTQWVSQVLFEEYARRIKDQQS